MAREEKGSKEPRRNKNLEDCSIEELQQEARRMGVQGVSSMNKSQLIQALRRQSKEAQ